MGHVVSLWGRRVANRREESLESLLLMFTLHFFPVCFWSTEGLKIAFSNVFPSVTLGGYLDRSCLLPCLYGMLSS